MSTSIAAPVARAPLRPAQPVGLDVDAAERDDIALDVVDRGKALELAVGARHRRDQGLGVFMPGRAKDLGNIAGFHHLAAIHHHDPVGDIGNHADIVRHDDHAEVAVAAEFLDQVEDLRLDRHIQRRRRFVGDDQVRVASQRQRDHHPLPHAAGKLVRIGQKPRFRLGDADLFEQLERAGLGLGAAQGGGLLDGFDQLCPHRHQRVQRGLRILEDHPDPVAPDTPHLALAAPAQLFALEQDRSAGDPPGRFEQVDDGIADCRLAGAGFAHQPHHLAGADGQADAAGGVDGAAAGREIDVEPLDFQQIGHRSFGFRASRIQSPSRLTAKTRTTSAMAGKKVIHHRPENRYSLPTRISVPSDGVVGGMP